MGDAGSSVTTQPWSTSHEHEELLNTIDKLREQGISRYVDIPQIVVCGDQSSGKSSTLEAICGLRFEIGDGMYASCSLSWTNRCTGLCTRYATEYALRRTLHSSISISIIPDQDRPDSERDSLSVWQPSTTSPDDFGQIMKEAATAMGIGPLKTFSHDRLRIEVCGPQQPHLTLVDVPGLFHARGKGQSDNDKQVVTSLVESYIENPRSIIMAVISAKNDKENQIVITFAEKHDPKGDRTIGVITKPDTLPLNSPSEQQYFTLAQNADPSTKFSLGWAVVRNRSFEEQASSQAERDETEKQFFASGIWKSLSTETKGVVALRKRLGKILQSHILTEMPNMLKDIDAGIAECEQKLATLGPYRGSSDEQRMYLLQASTKFGTLMASSNNGIYTDPFFGSGIEDSDFEKRVCARSMIILDEFRENINKHGHAIEVVKKMPKNYRALPGRPQKMLQDDFYKHVELLMDQNRGRELPGLFSPSIIKPLFLEQCKPWKDIVAYTLNEVFDMSRKAVRLTLQAVADDATVEGILTEIVNPSIDALESAVSLKAEQDLVPFEKHPSTFNHYFTDNLQKNREDQLMKDISSSLHGFLGVDPEAESTAARLYTGSFDVRKLAEALKQHTQKDMKRFAAIEASNAMFAYYKVALKRITDTFAIDTINELLIDKLASLFTPELVYKLDSAALAKVAGESEESAEERRALDKKLTALREAQKLCYRMHRHNPQGRSALQNPDKESTTSDEESEPEVQPEPENLVEPEIDQDFAWGLGLAPKGKKQKEKTSFGRF
ncbi:Interferon-induced GTP-binding protein Mx [Cyphellophora attinorum]|uniref:Interferon-induced GTP-binding protein Mx n=1 Tax=Cyphellophora attinorum TaxID=1664694 RepID=A0A0N0NJ46_9EURO|nr:Interferon-induced GTP-binding protein Mx [Phialophora attinorum]KPI36498.1 Interferon-induced GTP-binding protein Mx [Phialophora attinorum]